MQHLSFLKCNQCSSDALSEINEYYPMTLHKKIYGRQDIMVFYQKCRDCGHMQWSPNNKKNTKEHLRAVYSKLSGQVKTDDHVSYIFKRLKAEYMLRKEPTLKSSVIAESMGLTKPQLKTSFSITGESWIEYKGAILKDNKEFSTLISGMMSVDFITRMRAAAAMDTDDKGLKKLMDAVGVEFADLKNYVEELKRTRSLVWVAKPISTMKMMYSNTEARILA